MINMKLIEIIKNKKKKKLIEESNFANSINKFSKVDECVICHKKMTSACNSHVVPQFILKNVSENGKVAYGIALNSISINGIYKETGINNAHTFRLICKDCDNRLFKDYENLNHLLNFDELSDTLKSKILCEMALKTRLSHISMKYKSIVTRDMVAGGKIAKMEEEGKVFAERVDMNDHFDTNETLIRDINYGINPFVMLFNEVLDYNVSIATQTIINYNYDLNGKQIFDPSAVSFENIGNYFYLMILPLGDKTRIMFYIEKDKYEKVNDLVEQFKALSFEEKLHFIFISLIIHDEQFYMSPSFVERINKHDRKLKRLYMKSENDLRYTKRIKYFNKYNNYLKKELN